MYAWLFPVLRRAQARIVYMPGVRPLTVCVVSTEYALPLQWERRQLPEWPPHSVKSASVLPVLCQPVGLATPLPSSSKLAFATGAAVALCELATIGTSERNTRLVSAVFLVIRHSSIAHINKQPII